MYSLCNLIMTTLLLSSMTSSLLRENSIDWIWSSIAITPLLDFLISQFAGLRPVKLSKLLALYSNSITNLTNFYSSTCLKGLSSSKYLVSERRVFFFILNSLTSSGIPPAFDASRATLATLLASSYSCNTLNLIRNSYTFVFSVYLRRISLFSFATKIGSLDVPTLRPIFGQSLMPPSPVPCCSKSWNTESSSEQQPNSRSRSLSLAIPKPALSFIWLLYWFKSPIPLLLMLVDVPSC